MKSSGYRGDQINKQMEEDDKPIYFTFDSDDLEKFGACYAVWRDKPLYNPKSETWGTPDDKATCIGHIPIGIAHALTSMDNLPQGQDGIIHVGVLPIIKEKK